MWVKKSKSQPAFELQTSGRLPHLTPDGLDSGVSFILPSLCFCLPGSTSYWEMKVFGADAFLHSSPGYIFLSLLTSMKFSHNFVIVICAGDTCRRSKDNFMESALPFSLYLGSLVTQVAKLAQQAKLVGPQEKNA